MAINVLATVQALQETLSQAAKQSLDRRFGALFDKVYRKDVLWDAWRQVRNNGGGPGIDGSYAFRPGRKPHDAIREIERSITFQGYREVVDADLKSYFDTIPQDRLLELVGRRISDRRVLGLIKAWLRCGIMEEGKLTRSTTGTPQGGCISPLLSNVYLHAFDKMWQLRGITGTKLVRFADDFVILCRGSGHVAKRRAGEFLERLGLTLNREKTHVVHVRRGFDFLGMTFRYLPTSGQAKRLKYNCYRWPRGKAIASLKQKIRLKIGRRYYLSLQEIIREINPILRGWHNYFRVGQGERHFYRLDWFVMNRLRIFVKRKHNDPNRGVRNISSDLFDRLGLYRLARDKVSFI